MPQIINITPTKTTLDGTEFLVLQEAGGGAGSTKKFASGILGLPNEITFAFGDATPKLLKNITANKVIVQVDLIILTPFNGTNPLLSVGDAADNQRLMSSSENNPSQIGVYISRSTHLYLSNTDINLYITPGAGATQGNGLILLTIQN